MILTESSRAFNAPNENAVQGVPAFSPSYACKSVTASNGERRHTLTTSNRALYLAFYEQVADLDDDPNICAANGVRSIQFYASDAECLAAIEAALGGKA